MYTSLDTLCKKAEQTKTPLWRLVLLDDMKEQNLSEKEVFAQTAAVWQAMKQSDENYDPNLTSKSGLVGTDAEKLHQRRLSGEMICGDFSADVMEHALKISESNACMKRIVAAPTAGSCGVLPAVLLSSQKRWSIPDEKIVQALYTAGGIGGVIASRAFISGAEGGCQAEIGSASAMAAGALCDLRGGNAEDVAHAAALALKNLLGLACDPVAGLVEIPCVKRNCLGALNALSSADLALSGIRSRIPPDEVIDAMKSIGRRMDSGVRETGTGGLAATPTGEAIRDSLTPSSDRK